MAANNLAYLMLENGENVDVALTMAQTARRAMPDSPNSADTLAWAYYYKGTYGLCPRPSGGRAQEESEQRDDAVSPGNGIQQAEG